MNWLNIIKTCTDQVSQLPDNHYYKQIILDACNRWYGDNQDGSINTPPKSEKDRANLFKCFISKLEE
jgi:hypothetical protein